MAKDDNGLQPDRLARALVPDGEASPNVVSVVGFLAKGPAKNTWRLYLSLDFNAFLEFGSNAIVHAIRLDGPLGGTAMWIRRDAEVQLIASKSGAERGARSAFMDPAGYPHPVTKVEPACFNPVPPGPLGPGFQWPITKFASLCLDWPTTKTVWSCTG